MRNALQFSKVLTCALVGCTAACLAQTPAGSAFTYQGRLENGATPVNGTADLQLSLWDAATTPPGVQIGATQTLNNVSVAQGLFTVTANAAGEFGVASFDGQMRWLQIAVRSPAGSGSFTTLSPRQPLTAAPYAEFSLGPWQTSGTTISYTGGSVGIGTATPSNRLTVAQVADNNVNLAIDSGLTAAQFSSLRLNDRGTSIWTVNKNPSNDFSIREVNGTADRLYIAQGGNVGIGTTSPEVKLQITGGSDASPTGGGNLVCGQTTGLNIVIDNNEMMARNNGVVSSLSINKDGGDVFIATGATTHVAALEITGGADFSERFDIAGMNLQPGMVVVIDPEHPGELKASAQAYDRKVAGIISGAGGVRPGMMMSQQGTPADGAHPVALTGRVYCLVDTTTGAIEPGDFLTTSDTPGHAMKASDTSRASGAVLGKAMTALPAGHCGMVLVLVNLQ